MPQMPQPEKATTAQQNAATTKALESAYAKGWAESARWALRDDLIADIGSPAYIAARNKALGTEGTLG